MVQIQFKFSFDTSFFQKRTLAKPLYRRCETSHFAFVMIEIVLRSYNTHVRDRPIHRTKISVNNGQFVGKGSATS